MIIRDREYKWGTASGHNHDLRDVNATSYALRAYVRPAFDKAQALDVLVRSGTLNRGFFDVLATLAKSATIEEAKAIAEVAILLGMDTADRGDVP